MTSIFLVGILVLGLWVPLMAEPTRLENQEDLQNAFETYIDALYYISYVFGQLERNRASYQDPNLLEEEEQSQQVFNFRRDFTPICIAFVSRLQKIAPPAKPEDDDTLFLENEEFDLTPKKELSFYEEMGKNMKSLFDSMDKGKKLEPKDNSEFWPLIAFYQSFWRRPFTRRNYFTGIFNEALQNISEMECKQTLEEDYYLVFLEGISPSEKS